MKMLRGVHVVFAVAALLAPALSWAGNPVAIFGNGSTVFSAPGGGSSTQTITLNFAAQGNGAGSVAAIQTLRFSGANASDFAIVGGTCAPGTTQLDANSPTCTVIVQFTPSTSGAESATFQGSCTQVNVSGGFTLSCNGSTGTILSLAGTVLAAVISQLPFLDPRLVTALCVLFLVLGGYFAGRKKDDARA
jgi:hypothetical protein